MEPENPLIFISYVTSDRERVLPFYDHLKSRGFDVWMDFQRIRPGQNWNFEIERALEKSSIIIIFLSKHSVDHRGYAQREIKFSLDKQSEKLIDDIYTIPVLLDDDVKAPEHLKDFHYARASSANCTSDIEGSIRFQLSRLVENVAEVQKRANVAWTKTNYSEAWDGIPGYTLEVQKLRLSSEFYSDVHFINDFIHGEAVKEILRARNARFSQDSNLYNFGQDIEFRTDTLDMQFRDPLIIGKIISIQLLSYWFRAGAAHGGSLTKTYSFTLAPVAWISSPEEIFKEAYEALPVLQNFVRAELISKLRGDDGEDPDVEWINTVTSEWNNFKAFSFGKSEISFQFQQYQVAAYACGPQHVEVPYSNIVKLMKPEYISALEIEQVLWAS